MGDVREVLIIGEPGESKAHAIAALTGRLTEAGFTVRLEDGISRDFAPADRRWRSGGEPDPDLAISMVRAHLGNRTYARNAAHHHDDDVVIIYDGGPVTPLAHFPREQARKILARAYDFRGINPELLLTTYSAIGYLDSGARDRDLYVDNDRAIVLQSGGQVHDFVDQLSTTVQQARAVNPAKFRFSHAVDVERSPDQEIRSAVVFTSARHPAEIYGDALELLGTSIAERGWTLVTGGGGVGCMKRVNVGCQLAGGDTIQISTHDIDAKEGVPAGDDTIFIKSPHDLHPAKSRAQELRNAKVISRQMYERNLLFEHFADVALWTPGGIGSLLEGAIWMQYNQLGYQSKALGILDIDDCYKHLGAYLQDLAGIGFASPGDFDRFNIIEPLQYTSGGQYSSKVARQSIERYLDRVVDVDRRLRAEEASHQLG